MVGMAIPPKHGLGLRVGPTCSERAIRSRRKSIKLHLLRTLPLPHFLQAAHVLDVRRQSARKSVQRSDTHPGNRGGRCGGKADAHGYERLDGAPACGLLDEAPREICQADRCRGQGRADRKTSPPPPPAAPATPPPTPPPHP